MYISLLLTKNIDSKKYAFYKNKEIDIFKPKEDVFPKKCYISKNFDYDLIQKYRKTTIYENRTFISGDCKYDSIVLELKRIKMYCTYTHNLTYSYNEIEKELNNKDLKKYLNTP